MHRLKWFRGTETEADIVKWLRNAKAELHEGQNLWLFDHVIINENFETTYQQLKVCNTHIIWDLMNFCSMPSHISLWLCCES